MAIKQICGLLIGEFNAATIVNDEGIVYIGMGPVSDSEGEEVLAVDEIEARALYEWLGRALPNGIPKGERVGRDNPGNNAHPQTETKEGNAGA